MTSINKLGAAAAFAAAAIYLAAFVFYGALVQYPNSPDPTSALATWKTLNDVVAGLGSSNEIVGGLWVLLVSVGARQSNQLPRSLCYAGGLVGACGVATVYPVESLTELFGVSQLIWFVWLGLVLWQVPQDATASAG